MRRILPMALISAALVPVAPAAAKVTRTDRAIANDYRRDGRISHRWTVAQLRHALRNLNRDVREYGDYDEALRRAIRTRQRGASRGRNPGA